ncbi:hypothetical protein PAMP_023296 [Pampus punctatissimus]
MGQKSVGGGVSGSVTDEKPPQSICHLIGLMDDQHQKILSSPPPSQQTEAYIQTGRSNKHKTVFFEISLKIKEQLRATHHHNKTFNFSSTGNSPPASNRISPIPKRQTE